MKVNLLYCTILTMLPLCRIHKINCIETVDTITHWTDNISLISVSIDGFNSSSEIVYTYDELTQNHILSAIPPRLINSVTRSGFEVWKSKNNRYADSVYIKFDTNGEPKARVHYPVSSRNLITVPMELQQSTEEVQHIYDQSTDTYILKAIPPRLIYQVTENGQVAWTARNRYADAVIVRYDVNGYPKGIVHYPDPPSTPTVTHTPTVSTPQPSTTPAQAPIPAAVSHTFTGPSILPTVTPTPPILPFSIVVIDGSSSTESPQKTTTESSTSPFAITVVDGASEVYEDSCHKSVTSADTSRRPRIIEITAKRGDNSGTKYGPAKESLGTCVSKDVETIAYDVKPTNNTPEDHDIETEVGYFCWFNDDNKCVEIKFNDKKVWTYTGHPKDVYPKYFYYRKDVQIIVFEFKGRFYLYGCKAPQFKLITRDIFSDIFKKIKVLTKTDSDSYENNIDHYDFRDYGFLLMYKFKDNIKCNEIKYEESSVWKHSDNEGDEYPMFLYFDLISPITTYIVFNSNRVTYVFENNQWKVLKEKEQPGKSQQTFSSTPVTPGEGGSPTPGTQTAGSGKVGKGP